MNVSFAVLKMLSGQFATIGQGQAPKPHVLVALMVNFPYIIQNLSFQDISVEPYEKSPHGCPMLFFCLDYSRVQCAYLRCSINRT